MSPRPKDSPSKRISVKSVQKLVEIPFYPRNYCTHLWEQSMKTTFCLLLFDLLILFRADSLQTMKSYLQAVSWAYFYVLQSRSTVHRTANGIFQFVSSEVEPKYIK